MDHRPASLVREPALDGIRALAVIAVLLYHGRVSWMRGGFLGVDAFFVLSGYLITTLLVAEWRTSGAIDLKGFWMRRARRLLPALLAVVAAIIAYAAWFAPRDELGALRGDTLATLGYAANWRAIAVGSSYGDLFAAPSPLQHVWSLAIEEQWYLLWPLLLLGLLWLTRRSAVAVAVLAVLGAIGSAVTMAVLSTAADSSRAYYGTDTRCQSLLVGAALALAFGHVRRLGSPTRARPVLTGAAALAVALLAWAWAATPLHTAWLYRGGFLATALLVATVIAAATRPGPIRSLLSMRPLPQVGLVSYGLYLWHWPVFVMLSSTRTGLDGLPLLSLRLAVTAAVATLSFVALEQPVRAGTLRLPHPGLTGPALLATAVVAAIVATQGGRPAVTFAAPTAAPPTTIAATTPRQPAPSSPTKVAVVGDSVAFTMGAGLTRVGPKSGLDVWDQGLLGCGIVRGTMWIEGAVHDVAPKCADWPTRFRDLVDQWQPRIVVLLMGAWDAYDVRLDGEWVPFGTPRHDALVLDEVQRAVKVLGSRGAHVVVLTTPYFEPRHDVVDRDRSAFNPQRVDHLNALLRRVQDVTVLDLNRFLAPEGKFANDLYGVADVRGDGVHFTAAGEDLVGRWLAPQLAALDGCAQGVRNCSIAAASSAGRS